MWYSSIGDGFLVCKCLRMISVDLDLLHVRLRRRQVRNGPEVGGVEAAWGRVLAVNGVALTRR